MYFRGQIIGYIFFMAAQCLGMGERRYRPKYGSYFSGTAKILNGWEEISRIYLASCKNVLASLCASIYMINTK
jgi:hypothetical protein